MYLAITNIPTFLFILLLFVYINSFLLKENILIVFL